MASANNKNTVAAATTILQSGEGISQTAPPGQNSLTGLGLEHQDQTAKTAAWILMSFQSNPHHSMSYSPTPSNLNSQGNAYTQIPNQIEAPSKLFTSLRSNLMQQGSEAGTGASQRDYNTNGAFVSLSQAMSQYMTPTGSQGQRDSTGNLHTATSQNSFAAHHQYHMGTHLPQDRNFPSNGFGNLIATHNQASDRGINIYNSYEMQQRDFYQAASQSFLLQKQTSNQMNAPTGVRQEAVDLRIGSFQKDCDQQRDQQKRGEQKHVSISHQNSATKQREKNLQSSASTADKASTNKSSNEGNSSSMSDLATHFRTVQQQPFNILGQNPGFGVFQQSTQSATPSADKTMNKALNEDKNPITSDQAMSFSLAQQQQHLNFLRQAPNYAMFQPSHFLSTPLSSQNMSSHFPYASQNSFLPYVFNANGMGAAAMTQGNPYYLPMSMFPTAEAYYTAAAANLAQAQFPSSTGPSNLAQFAPSVTQSSGTNKPTNPAAKPPRSRKKTTSTAASSAQLPNVNTNLQSKNPGLAHLLNPHPDPSGSYYNSGMINTAALSEVSPSNPNGNEHNSYSDTNVQSKQNKQMKRKPKEKKIDEAIRPNTGKKLKSADMDWFQQHTVNGKHPEEFENQMKSLKQSMILEMQAKNADVRCSSEMSTENNTLGTKVGKNGAVSEKSCSENRAFSPAYIQEYKEPSLMSLSQIVNAVSVHTDTISSQSYSRQSYQSSLCNIDPMSTRDFLEEDTSQSDKLIPESSFQPFSSLPLYQNNCKVDNETISHSNNTAERQENKIPRSAMFTETQQKYGTFTDTCPSSLTNNYSQARPINNSSKNSQWTTASSETQSIFNVQNSSESHLSGSTVQSGESGNTDGNILADGGLSTPVTSRSNCDSVPSMSCLHVDTGVNKSDDDGHSAMFNSPEEVQVYPTSQNEPSSGDCLVKEGEGEAADNSSHENKLMFPQNLTGEHSRDRTMQIYGSAECNDPNSPKTEKTLKKCSAQTDRQDEDITHKTNNCFQKYQPHLSGPFNVQNNTSLPIPGSENGQYSHMPTDHNKSYEPVSLENISTAVTSSGDYLTWPQYGGYTKENKNPYTLSYLPPYLKSPTKHQGVHEADPVGVPDQVSAFSYMWDRTNVLAPGDKQEADFDSSVVQKCDFDSRLSGVSPEDALLLRPKCNSQGRYMYSDTLF